MAQLIEVKVPDIGDFSDVPVIDVFVKPGDTVAVDDALVTLESDKATMDVPSSTAGVVREVLVKLGDKVSEGMALIRVEPSPLAGAGRGDEPKVTSAPPPPPPAERGAGGLVAVTVPDIGDFADVPVIDLFVKVGDTVKVDDAIVTLESDKATMDVPSTAAGVVREVLVKLGDKVSEGVALIRVEAGAAPSSLPFKGRAGEGMGAEPAKPDPIPLLTSPLKGEEPTVPPAAEKGAALPLGSVVHASPSVRAFARELGVDLGKVKPSGPKNRILAEDVSAYVKGVLSGAPAAPAAAPSGGISGGGTLNLLPWPKVDFSKFGPVEVKELSRIKKLSAANLARNWVMIPAVTYHEDADITELEAFRVQLNKENEKSGAKVTMLAFLIKACVKAMQQYPEFNSSLDGDNLILKKYFNIGFAADTPNGLVVPVLKDADKKGVLEIASETSALAKKARDGKLTPAEMSGACFTISSLGGIGGTYFAPIVNAPEVAILGVNKSSMQPVWDGKAFVPRLILPLSLTADHRVIDGALATRFNVLIALLLADMRRVLV